MSSFAARLTLRIVILMTTLTAATLATGGWLLHRQFIHSMELLHEGECRELAEILGNDDKISDEEIARRIGRDADSDAALFFLQIHDNRGAVRFRSSNLGMLYLPDLTGIAQHTTVQLEPLGSMHLTEQQLNPWHIQVGTSLVPLQQVMQDYYQIAIVLLLAVAGVSILCGIVLSRVTLKPVRTIEESARRISGENLSERIPIPPSRDELASLATLLNHTFQRLESAFGQVQRFTADASHELKTPLALVRLNAEKLRPALESNPEMQETLDDLLEEVGGINRIVENLLFLSRSDGRQLEVRRKPIDVASFVRDFSEDADVLAEDRGMHFKMAQVDDGQMPADGGLLRQLLLNLLTNSLSAMQPGGTVSLSVRRLQSAWALTVSDEGTGLPADMVERVFERFVRIERTEMSDQAKKGHGLGLAICRAIAELHRGEIRAVNRTDRTGLNVVVTLPAS